MSGLRGQLDAWLERQRTLRLSPCTVRSARYNVGAFLDWLERRGVDRAEQLRPGHLEDWQRDLAGRTTRRGVPLKPSTVNKHIECVRGFLEHLARHGLAARTLVEAACYVKQPQRLQTSVLTHAQVRRLIDVVDTGSPEGQRDRTMLELLYSTGIRVGELLGLDAGDVDAGAGTAVVTGKGDKQRVVPVGRTALRWVETYRVAVRPFLAASGEAALFVARGGGRLPYHSFRRLLGRYAEKAGLEIPVSPHTFRRSCATELIRGGANMYHVKEILGHESLDTLRHYARLTIVDLKKTHARCHPREREGRNRD